jgi:hypothetical protein
VAVAGYPVHSGPKSWGHFDGSSSPPEMLEGAGVVTGAGAVPKVTVVLTERRVFLQPWEAITGSLELAGDEEALQDALLAPRRIREEQLRPPTETCKRKEFLGLHWVSLSAWFVDRWVC